MLPGAHRLGRQIAEQSPFPPQKAAAAPLEPFNPDWNRGLANPFWFMILAFASDQIGDGDVVAARQGVWAGSAGARFRRCRYWHSCRRDSEMLFVSISYVSKALSRRARTGETAAR